MLENPEMFKSMIQSHPQLKEVLKANPAMEMMLNNPAVYMPSFHRFAVVFSCTWNCL
jgi:hypothetical protein